MTSTSTVQEVGSLRG